jgi:hypothetical protein
LRMTQHPRKHSRERIRLSKNAGFATGSDRHANHYPIQRHERFSVISGMLVAGIAGVARA